MEDITNLPTPCVSASYSSRPQARACACGLNIFHSPSSPLLPLLSAAEVGSGPWRRLATSLFHSQQLSQPFLADHTFWTSELSFLSVGPRPLSKSSNQKQAQHSCCVASRAEQSGSSSVSGVFSLYLPTWHLPSQQRRSIVGSHSACNLWVIFQRYVCHLNPVVSVADGNIWHGYDLIAVWNLLMIRGTSGVKF